MNIQKEEVQSTAIKFVAEEGGQVIGRAYVYLIKNDLPHDGRPYGLLEDVFVEAEHRGKGYGKQLVEMVIAEAKKQGCYKLIGQCRYGKEKVHELYMGLGFADHGKNFRMDFDA